MIGNDVVDLHDPETLAEQRHPRFDERVFSDVERELIAISRAPDRLRWVLWGAKESAFKLARKLDASTVFSPRRFVVTLADARRGVVHHRDRIFRVRIDASATRVHVIATDRCAVRGTVLAGVG